MYVGSREHALSNKCFNGISKGLQEGMRYCGGQSHNGNALFYTVYLDPFCYITPILNIYVIQDGPLKSGQI